MKKRIFSSPKVDYLLSQTTELHRLYYDEGLTTRQIAKHFNMSKHPVEDAMQKLGWDRRHIRTKGYKPTKREIEEAIFDDKRGIAEIAAEFGCDPGAIRYWAKQYGIDIPKLNAWDQRNARRGYSRPSKDALQSLYDVGYSLADIGSFFGVTKLTITNAFKFYGLEIKESGWGHKRLTCLDGHKVKSTYEQRVDDWLFTNGFEHIYEPCVPFDKHSKADFFTCGFFIEIFGVTDAEFYDKRKQYKLAQYKANNLPTIVLNFWDFDNGHKGAWERKLNHLKSSRKALMNG
jgi:hypothetical protein